MTKSEEIIAKSERYLARNYKPLPFAIVKGSGVWVWDADGKKYIDMLSTYSANSFGHLDCRIVDAGVEQLSRLASNPRCFYNDKLADFAEAVANFCGMDKVLPKNTGTEAVEATIILSRKYAYKVKGIPDNQAIIIGCNDNFAGRTLGSRSLSTTQEYRYQAGPLAGGFDWVPFNDPDALERSITENTAAFFVEPIQGEAGIKVPSDGYLPRVREICDRHNVLLVFDEVQTGFGRTGYDFAYQHENVKPNLLILAKALSGGIPPISAVVGPQEIMDIIEPGDDGSTFGGNPFACACAIEALSVFKEDKLSENAMAMGNYFIPQLKSMKSHWIKEVRGRGLMIGVELFEEAGGARRFCEELGRNGVLCYYTHENVLRLSPPLIITRKELDWALNRIKTVFERP